MPSRRIYWRTGLEMAEIMGKTKSRISELKAEGMPHLPGPTGLPVYCVADVFDWGIAREGRDFKNRPPDGVGWWPRLVRRQVERLHLALRGLRETPDRYAASLAKRLGCTPEAARNALRELAEQERVRLMDAFDPPIR